MNEFAWAIVYWSGVLVFLLIRYTGDTPFWTWPEKETPSMCVCDWIEGLLWHRSIQS